MNKTAWAAQTADSVMQRHPILSEKWSYEWGVILTGLLELWLDTHESAYFDYVQKNIDFFVSEDGQIRAYHLKDYNIDNIQPGRLLFALYEATGDDRYRKAIFLLREQLRQHPRVAEGGFWHKLIYPHQMWLDGAYMGCPFYTRFAAAFDDFAAFDDVAHQLKLLAWHTRDPYTGLLYHGWDETHQQKWADSATGRSPHFWGRAIGWYLMALVDVLDYFPATHPDHQTLLDIYATTISAVLRYQDAASGVWYQVIDQGKRKGNYLESSASCMFVYAIAKGVRKGYLAPGDLVYANKAYVGILENFVVADEGINVTHICSVAGLGGTPYRSGSFDYYMNEPIVTNDYK
ncbi:MAG: glycoside hydrolase family 88 protein, partial [Anaerolineae bacterium]|nr:glycoside hydrolase family 88 protein [Anaerolineae bacterium]